jgi:hypothetical protein
MAVLADANLREVLGVLQKGKNPATRDGRTKINHALVPVSPDDFENAVDDRLCNYDARQLLHTILPG